MKSALKKVICLQKCNMEMPRNQDDAKPVPTVICTMYITGDGRQTRGDKTQKTRDRRRVTEDRTQGWLTGDGGKET